jgi:hypothetical protein
VTTKQQKRRYWTFGVIILGLALAWWRLGGDQSPTGQPGANDVVQAAEVSESEADTNGITATVVDDVPPPDESIEVTALDQFKERTRYPASTRRLTADSHDLLNPGARYERRSKLPDEDDPEMDWQVLFTADRFFVRDEEPVLISLQLWNGDKPVLPVQVSMRAEPVNGGNAEAPLNLALRTDGKSKTAVFTPNDHWPDYVGQVRVSSEFSAQKLKPQSGYLDFFFTGKNRVPARFTGRISDRLDTGNLLFDVELEVFKNGLFRIEGSLFDGSGQPFGWARYEGQLYEGKAIATLQFYGLLFHDTDAVGPYVLRGLRGYRLRPGDVPHREDMQEFAGDYLAKGSYALNDFHSDINANPRRQRMIEMYEDAERRGVKLTNPEYTGDEN